jgi:hypothetical protein
VPKFCRHNRLLQNCPICSREQAVELRPLISSSAPRVSEPRPTSSGRPGGASSERATRRDRSRNALARSGVTVRRLRATEDDGYRCGLVPGLKSSEDARRLAEEVAFAATRLNALSTGPPGLYRNVADRDGDLEERTWLAFLIAYLYPIENEDPFASIEAVRTGWNEAEQLRLEQAETGPRTAHDMGRGLETIRAYRSWSQRAGSQSHAFVGEAAWSEERRFARIYERLALPGLTRDARFELLVSLGAIGVYPLAPASLMLGGDDQVTLAAKRALAIGEPLVLERRAAALAEACSVPLAALDLALYNWERGERATAGMRASAQPAAAELDAALAALQL